MHPWGCFVSPGMASAAVIGGGESAWHHLSSQTIMLSLRYPLTGLLTPESLVPYPNQVAHWSLRV